MKYYALKHIKTGRYVAGTDFARADGKPQQIFCTPDHPPLLFNGERLGIELKRRHINLTDYKVVVVDIQEARL